MQLIKMGTLQSSPPKIACPQVISDLDVAKSSPIRMWNRHLVDPYIVLSSLR